MLYIFSKFWLRTQGIVYDSILHTINA